MSQGARKTHQKRSRDTRDKLLKALENLLLEKDFADISVAEIAASAGVSAASIYRRFDKKEGFIPVLFDLYLERLNEWASSPEAQLQVDPTDLHGALREIANQAWQQLTSQVHIMRAIHIHARRHIHLVGDKFTAFEDAMLQSMRLVLSLFEGQYTRPNSEKTARMMAYYFNNILLEKGLFGKEGAHFDTPDDRAFTDEIADFAYGYLQTPEIPKKKVSD